MLGVQKLPGVLSMLDQSMEQTASGRNSLPFRRLNCHPVAMRFSLAAAHLDLVRPLGTL